MKKIGSLQFGIVIFLFLIISSDSISQVHYNVIPTSSTMIIHGTSSIHDWQMEVTDLECSATLLVTGNYINSIRETRFLCKTKSIISDYKLMNNKTYEALKADEFSIITFTMTNAGDISLPGNEFNGSINGFLSIAGEIKEIDVPFRGRLLTNGQVELEGRVPLKMSEFNIDPPTALMGTLKTGDEVWISYSLKMERDMSKETIATRNADNNNSK